MEAANMNEEELEELWRRKAKSWKKRRKPLSWNIFSKKLDKCGSWRRGEELEEEEEALKRDGVKMAISVAAAEAGTEALPETRRREDIRENETSSAMKLVKENNWKRQPFGDAFGESWSYRSCWKPEEREAEESLWQLENENRRRSWRSEEAPEEEASSFQLYQYLKTLWLTLCEAGGVKLSAHYRSSYQSYEERREKCRRRRENTCLLQISILWLRNLEGSRNSQRERKLNTCSIENQ